MNHPVTSNLLIILVLIAGLTWCTRRGLLKGQEVIWIGAAMLFFATSLLFRVVLTATRPLYGGHIGLLLGVTTAMVIPFILAVAYGIFLLYRSLREKEFAALDIDGMTLRLVEGNLAALGATTPLDALVSPANTALTMRSGVARALKSFGGTAIEREARAHAPLAVGRAVATGAGRLNARALIHAVVQEEDGSPDRDKIKKALDGAFQCARTIGARHIALPAFGTGKGQVAASAIAPMTVDAAVRARKDFDEIVIIAFSRSIAAAYQAEFARLAQKYPAPAGRPSPQNIP